MAMQAVAIGWQVYEITHDPLDLGLIGLAEFLPVLILALATGAIADRFERRRVAALALGLDLLFALALVVLSRLEVARAWPFYLVAAGVGLSRAFLAPARRALLPSVVPEEDLANAVVWTSNSWQIAGIAGPALGGGLYLLGVEVVYATAAVVFLLSAVAMLAIHPRPVAAATSAAPVTWKSVLEGVRVIRETPILLGAISLDLFAVLFGGAVALLPALARDVLHTDAAGLGLLRAGLGLGAAATGFGLAAWPVRRSVGRVLFAAVTTFGLATIALGLSTSFWVAFAALVVASAADMISVFVRATVVPLVTPDRLRGRVAAVEQVFIGASNELGAFESGAVAALLGTVPSIILGGVGTLVVVALWMRLFPELARLDRFADLSP